MKTPGQVPRVRFYPTAPIQDLPVQVIQIHLAIFSQPSTCLFRAPPVLSKFTFSMLSFCIAVSRKTLCITDLNKTTLHRPHLLLPWGLQFTSISDRRGSVVPFPHGMSFSVQWKWGGSPLHTAGPRSLCHQGKLQELALILALPFLTPFTGSLPMLLFTGGSHHGKAAWHPLIESIFWRKKPNISPQQKLFPWMHRFGKAFNKFCLIFWQHIDPFLCLSQGDWKKPLSSTSAKKLMLLIFLPLPNPWPLRTVLFVLLKVLLGQGCTHIIQRKWPELSQSW